MSEREKTAADGRRPNNEALGRLMRACADAFMPDYSATQEALEAMCGARVGGDWDGAVERLREMLRNLTEYAAVAGAYGLLKAARDGEDAQIAAVMAAYKGIGAPGDWGYSSPRGAAWHALLAAYDRTMDEREKTEKE